eukprot:1161105-Pelagomonas_calceolata.AAC.14
MGITIPACVHIHTDTHTFKHAYHMCAQLWLVCIERYVCMRMYALYQACQSRSPPSSCAKRGLWSEAEDEHDETPPKTPMSGIAFFSGSMQLAAFNVKFTFTTNSPFRSPTAPNWVVLELSGMWSPRIKRIPWQKKWSDYRPNGR